jgi:hypothetical protein
MKNHISLFKDKFKCLTVHSIMRRTGENMDDKIDLKKLFIVGKEEYEMGKLEDHIKTISKYCKTDDQGGVHIEYDKLNNKEKTKLVLVARFLANKLEKNISEDVSIEVVSKAAHIDEHQARARLSDITQEGFARQMTRGKYVVFSHKIDDFLSSLEVKK